MSPVLGLYEFWKQFEAAEKVRYYQASSSEMYGKVQEVPNLRPLRFGHGLLMPVQRFMLIGSQLIIVSLTIWQVWGYF